MSKSINPATIAKAVALLVAAEGTRRTAWPTMYGATVEALSLGLTPAALSKATEDENGAWAKAGYKKVSAETLASYVTAHGIVTVAPSCAAVTDGKVHKTVATAKSYGVTAARISSWAKATVTAIGKADESDRVTVLGKALTALAEEGKAAKAAKAESKVSEETAEETAPESLAAPEESPADTLAALMARIGADAATAAALITEGTPLSDATATMAALATLARAVKAARAAA